MKKKEVLFKLSNLLVCASMLGLAACGNKKDKNRNNPAQNPATPPIVQPNIIEEPENQEVHVLEGSYRAVLLPTNPNINNDVMGTARITIKDDNVVMKVDAINASPGTHTQYIHYGTACVPMEADLSGDGILDAVEAQPFSGPMLIPLDSNLEEQMSGTFPKANSSGSYSWGKEVALPTLLEDLKTPDIEVTDSIVKLVEGESLRLEGRVIEIRGVSSSTNLPESVASIDGHPIHETVPVACGVIKRIEPEDGQESEETVVVEPETAEAVN